MESFDSYSMSLPLDEGSGTERDEEFMKLLSELKNEKEMSADHQLKRILTTTFSNPYEVLMVSPDSLDDEIKRQYRQLTQLLHPDKCPDPRAGDAFTSKPLNLVLDQAYKELMDPDKRKAFQRIFREAKERVAIRRAEENRQRAKRGLSLLSEDSLEADIKQEMKEILSKLEESRKYRENLEFSRQKREREEADLLRQKEELQRQQNKEWETYRDKRVKNWVRFRERVTKGKKKSKFETKPPVSKTEERLAIDERLKYKSLKDG